MQGTRQKSNIALDLIPVFTAWVQECFQKTLHIRKIARESQVKALLCKEEAVCEHDPGTLPATLDQTHFKCTETKWALHHLN